MTGATLPVLPPDLSAEGKGTSEKSNANTDHEKGEKETPQNKQDGTLDVKEETKAPPPSQGKEEKEKGSTEPAYRPGEETVPREEMTREQLQSAILSEVHPIGSVPLKTVRDYLSSVGKKHFKELSMEEAKALHRKILSAKAESTDATDEGRAKICSACPVEIAVEVEQYSLKRFRRPLCRSCQEQEKGSLPNQTTPQRKAPGQVPDAKF